MAYGLYAPQMIREALGKSMEYRVNRAEWSQCLLGVGRSGSWTVFPIRHVVFVQFLYYFGIVFLGAAMGRLK